MKQFIVLEGIDGSGKTGIAKYLQRKLKGVYVHDGPNEESLTYATYLDVINFAATCHVPVIIDRLHWGSYAYGEVYRGAPTLSMEDLVELERVIYARGGMTVWVDRPLTACLDVVRADTDQYYVTAEPGKFEHLSLLYDEIWTHMYGHTDTNVFRACNVTPEGYDAIKRGLLDLMEN